MVNRWRLSLVLHWQAWDGTISKPTRAGTSILAGLEQLHWQVWHIRVRYDDIQAEQCSYIAMYYYSYKEWCHIVTDIVIIVGDIKCHSTPLYPRVASFSQPFRLRFVLSPETEHSFPVPVCTCLCTGQAQSVGIRTGITCRTRYEHTTFFMANK